MKIAKIRQAVTSRYRRNYPLYDQADLVKLKQASQFNAWLLDQVRPLVVPGVSTAELNQFVHDETLKHGHIPACLGYKGYPKSICTSINDVVCHGIPDKTTLNDGDIVNIDLTTIVDGWHGDQSETFLVGEVSEMAKAVTQVAFDCLYVGIEAARPYGTVYDIARAITRYAQSRGFGVVRNYQGHGIGKAFHQPPGVPHYPHSSTHKSLIVPGCCFTIEPMINSGSHETKLDEDGWTVRTSDGSLSAQFEHQLYMSESGPVILTQTEHGPKPGHHF